MQKSSSLNNADIPKFLPDQKVWLRFCGPIHPSRVESLAGVSAYISLGLYNLVLLAVDVELRKRVDAFVVQNEIAWEEWEIDGKKITKVQYSSLVAKMVILTKDILQPLFAKDRSLVAAGREYVTLLAASLSRGARCTPTAAQELIEFDSVFRGCLLQSGNKSIAVKQGLLVTTNAALSRYTSQTYAGTSPIIESECHYYTHSLLGIGTASLALTQIRRFVERAVISTRLIDRVLRLRDKSAAHKMLQSMSPDDPFWDKDFLAGNFTPNDPAQQRFDHAEDPRLHLLTYFSGRDGFRATPLSLSAPLELLQSCNSVSWTLLTLTHEISHILVDGVLGFLLPNPHSTLDLRNAIELLDRGDNAPNLFAQLQQLLCYSIWQMASPNTDELLGPQELGHILEQDGQSLYEIVTHCFDFLYFYMGNAEVYIPALWASWSVIPNIEHRISEYLVRSLCALLTNHVRRENGINVTIDQLCILLNKVKDDFPDAQYVPQAISELTSRRNEYAIALSARRPMALFVRHFLYSSEIAQQLNSPDATIDFKPLEFNSDLVENPLRFIHDFSRDSAANHLRSAWLLQQLAFGGEI